MHNFPLPIFLKPSSAKGTEYFGPLFCFLGQTKRGDGRRGETASAWSLRRYSGEFPASAFRKKIEEDLEKLEGLWIRNLMPLMAILMGIMIHLVEKFQ
ncbi:hypothetical protein MA16_Dca009303 [Dendrobium catenatum]|uniref:Uncharacterized protein n=1 Tax=Dendrobium catenatum TaxID=906689 RepID=A0A2I0WZ22_9ASPA|nr:hypothetical protein MA16_Dca009303 [Dendrobium catenatum]